MDKRFIEETFPVKEISKESAREKRIRHGHISTMHLWWARRPLASSRATNYASLIPTPKDEIDWVKKKNFIIELSKWENSLNKNLLEQARKEIIEFNGGTKPKVLDPFSGGGAIPLEALRLGCETYSNDYNPVAVLIEKCTLEFPQKFSRKNKGKFLDQKNSFVYDLKKYASIVLMEAQKEIGNFYPIEDDGSIPVAYIWARTINCQNPACNAEIPLMRQFWLSKSKNKKIALKPYVEDEMVKFKIVGQNENFPTNFNPSNGTISRAVAHCLVCGSSVDAKETRKLFRECKSSEKMIAVVKSHPKKTGKIYRLATNKDLQIFAEVESCLSIKKRKFMDLWGFDPVPSEEIIPSEEIHSMSRSINAPVYGLTKWEDLFNLRQKLALVTFIEKIRQLPLNFNDEYDKAIITYLAVLLDKYASFNTRHGFWLSIGEKATQIFARHAIPMLWDYVETNPFSNSFSWNSQVAWVLKCIEHLADSSNDSAKVSNYSATNLDFPDDYFDAVFTDPPYYDNVLYSYLSDFFYVWLKSILSEWYGDLFVTPLVQKKNEIIAIPGKSKKTSEFFEKNLKKSFKEIHRVLKPGGIVTIVYAHKTTEGWETVINSLIDSGLTVTASWPISTEMSIRLNARTTASLASSIYIVARKIKKSDIGWFKEVKTEIKEYIPDKLDKLWEEGISGADFFIAAIGSAIEVFGKYEKVLDNEGNEIRADKLLSLVRDVVTDYTVKYLLHDDIADDLSPLTKFYLLWRWNYQDAKVPFDEARKLAQSAGIDLIDEWNKGYIVKRGNLISVIGPEEREKNSLVNSNELIDVLHLLCKLWKEGNKDEMKLVLKKSNYGNKESFFKVAQAISETFTFNHTEKMLIQGFLAGKDHLNTNIKEDDSQTILR